MKAIQTQYKGYNFRSRLEARWAVLFDNRGIKWRYEPEGFVMRDGTCYLPDFYLYEMGVWVEVKPYLPSPRPNRFTGCANQNKVYTYLEDIANNRGEAAMVVSSDPADYGLFIGWDYKGQSYWHLANFTDTDGGTSVYAVDQDRDRDLFMDACYEHTVYYHDKDKPSTKNALTAFRSARFEFGEKGATL